MDLDPIFAHPLVIELFFARDPSSLYSSFIPKEDEPIVEDGVFDEIICNRRFFYRFSVPLPGGFKFIFVITRTMAQSQK